MPLILDLLAISEDRKVTPKLAFYAVNGEILLLK